VCDGDCWLLTTLPGDFINCGLSSNEIFDDTIESYHGAFPFSVLTMQFSQIFICLPASLSDFLGID